MATHTIISLFSGAGFLDAAIRVAVPGSRTVCHVEREIPAAAILAARMRDGALHEAPIWSDVTTFDGCGWRGKVDGIIGGSPCQDLSVAGRRAGIGGQRSGLIEHYFRIAEEVQPGWLFWENVGGVVSSLTLHHRSEIMAHLDALQFAADSAETPRERWYIERHRERLHWRLLKQHGISALLYVQCRMEAMGYRVETGLFSAAEVSAPHKRERLFVLGYRRCEHIYIQQREVWSKFKGTGCELAHAIRTRLEEWGSQRGDDGPQQPSAERDCLPLFPPGPGDTEAWRRILAEHPDLAPAVIPGFHRLDDEFARVDRLRAAGNGCVVLQAALAFASLARRAGIEL